MCNYFNRKRKSFVAGADISELNKLDMISAKVLRKRSRNILLN
jgi:hypothetical protein